MSDSYQNDLLERKPFADQLEKFLLTEHQFVEGALVVSLHAPFGAGKSTFLKMWCEDLKQRRQQNPNLPRPLILNAWESDYCGDPLIALISAISQPLTDAKSPDAKPKQAAKLREAAKDIGNFALGLGNAWVAYNFGVDPMAAGQYAKERKDQRNEPDKKPFNALDAYEAKHDALLTLKDELSNVFGSDTPKAIIIVDELDRCRPDYAISYLETIKHIFDQRGLIFVIAADPLQLQSATKALFGPDINFDNYYRKFVQRRISLPDANENAIYGLIREYTQRYIIVEKKRLSMLPLDRDRLSYIEDIIKSIHPNPRQLQEIFRIMGHALASNESNKDRILWGYAAGVVLMSALCVTNHTLYARIGRSDIDLEHACNELHLMIKSDHDFAWWLKLFLAGYNTPNLTTQVLTQQLKKFGVMDKAQTDQDCSTVLSNFYNGWSQRGQQNKQFFAVIYNIIENVRSFGQ